MSVLAILAVLTSVQTNTFAPNASVTCNWEKFCCHGALINAYFLSSVQPDFQPTWRSWETLEGSGRAVRRQGDRSLQRQVSNPPRCPQPGLQDSRPPPSLASPGFRPPSMSIFNLVPPGCTHQSAGSPGVWSVICSWPQPWPPAACLGDRGPPPEAQKVQLQSGLLTPHLPAPGSCSLRSVY